MKLFFAGMEAAMDLYEKYRPPYVLQSFYYANAKTTRLISECKMYLLDSGAFTFMANTKKAVDFDEYLTRYIDYINKYDVKYFFELDIDAVVGYEEVKRLRARLENETGKKCIPVWHKSRGIEDFKKICGNYDYIAIGGLVTKEIKPSEYLYLKKLVKLAADCGTKVHGLGFTRSDAVDYGFYSVDSTGWVEAQKFGTLKKFDGEKMIKVKKPAGTRAILPAKQRLEIGFSEWCKYQKYLDADRKGR